MLETHLIHTLHVDEVEVGLFFVIYGCTYTVISPALGKVLTKIPKIVRKHTISATQICDTYGYVSLFTTIGNILLIVVLLLIGPVPWFGLELSVTLERELGGIFGFSGACLIVTSFSRGYTDAIAFGFQDSVETAMMVSGTDVKLLIMALLLLYILSFQAFGKVFTTWDALLDQHQGDYW